MPYKLWCWLCFKLVLHTPLWRWNAILPYAGHHCYRPKDDGRR